MRRQLAAQYLVIEIGVHVGQDGAARLDALDPCQRVVEREMAWMRPVAQRVDDPEIETCQGRDALRRDVAEIGRIGEVAEPKAKRRDIAVLLQDTAEPSIGPPCPSMVTGVPAVSRCSVEDRRIVAAGRRDEAIGEPDCSDRRGRLVEIDVDRAGAA